MAGPIPASGRGEMFGILWQDESAPTGLTAAPGARRHGLPGRDEKGAGDVPGALSPLAVGG